jgi:hypothetical protein
MFTFHNADAAVISKRFQNVDGSAFIGQCC